MDIETFRSYYDSYYDQLCHFLNYYTNDNLVKEDVLQDVFLKLWENRDHIEVRYVKTYLFHAARNRILNHLRDEDNRHVLLEKWFTQQKYEVQGRDCFNIDRFIETINKITINLPPRCQKIFMLSHDEKLTYKQIAEKLDISVKTVETQMSIALRKIRENISIIPLVFITFFIN